MFYGLIGEHLGHSFSRVVHGMMSSDPYDLVELAPGELEGFLRARDFCGVNVTIPYKRAVIPFLDRLDESAERTGAVNTIVRRGSELWGYNTDYYGFVKMAKHFGVDFTGARTVVLGAGGAAKAVAAAARALGASEVLNAVRRPSGPGQLSIFDDATFDGCNVLINATPVGMYPHWNEAPVNLPALLPRMNLTAVLDCIYNPIRTPLVLEACSEGGVLPSVSSLRSSLPLRSACGPLPFTWPRAAMDTEGSTPPSELSQMTAVGGLYMLVGQAVKARELFTGEKLPADTVERLYDKLLRSKRNIVLCGMPSSGKSTLGQELARATGRRFEDSDSVVELQAGMSIPQIFEREGEHGFRARETAALESLAPEQGLVIATGGGMPLRPENIRLMHHNGIICLLQRDLALLQPGGGRPLSGNRSDLERLYNSRKAAYLAAADVIIDNNGSVEDALAQLLALC